MGIINFRNILNNAAVKLGKISNSNSDFRYNEFIPVVNAVEIDWNGAEVDENKVINTTEELLSWIKEGRSSSKFTDNQLEALQDAANIILLIKEYFTGGQSTQLEGYYWYIGTVNSFAISNIQSSNTIGGWHKIGASLSGFVLDTNNDQVQISDTRVPYYIIIPNELNIYDSLNDLMYYGFDSVPCNIPGYKAYKWSKEKSGSIYDGVRIVTGVILKQ